MTKGIRVAVFKAANNWPLYAALGNKILEGSRIHAEIVNVSSAKQQMNGQINGEHDIVHTAADNVVAIHLEPEAGIQMEKKPRIFMGGDDGFLSVHSSRKVRSFHDLKGRRVGFDSTTSGFAFVLKKILSSEGLDEGTYEEVVVGGTELRFKALVNGEIDAAIMTPPHDLLCSAAGFTKLADAASYLPRYQGVVGACLPNSLSPPLLRGYKTALVKGLTWLKERKNKAAAIDILRTHLQVEGSDDLYSDLYDAVLLRERGGFDHGGNIDPEGLERVVALRREFSRTAKSSSPSEYLVSL